MRHTPAITRALAAACTLTAMIGLASLAQASEVIDHDETVALEAQVAGNYQPMVDLPLMNRLAAQGGREAQRALGFELLAEPGPRPYDFSAGRSWLEQATAQGDCVSAHGLAAIHGWPKALFKEQRSRNYYRMPNDVGEYKAWLNRAKQLGCTGARILLHAELTDEAIADWPKNKLPAYMMDFAEALYEAGVPGMNRVIMAEYERRGDKDKADKWEGILRPALSADLLIIYTQADSGKAEWQWQLGTILLRLEAMAEQITNEPETSFGMNGTARQWIARAAKQGHPLALGWMADHPAKADPSQFHPAEERGAIIRSAGEHPGPTRLRSHGAATHP